MRVLVCGGRDFGDRDLVVNTLSGLWETRGRISAVIHGSCAGADTLADDWALWNGVVSHPFVAQWTRLGRAAGPIRNQQMLDEGKPDLVVAFPGGRGTADMVRRARAAGVEVVEPTP